MLQRIANDSVFLLEDKPCSMRWECKFPFGSLLISNSWRERDMMYDEELCFEWTRVKLPHKTYMPSMIWRRHRKRQNTRSRAQRIAEHVHKMLLSTFPVTCCSITLHIEWKWGPLGSSVSLRPCPNVIGQLHEVATPTICEPQMLAKHWFTGLILGVYLSRCVGGSFKCVTCWCQHVINNKNLGK